MEHTETLSQTIDSSWQALLEALARPEAYIEMLIIATAVTLASSITFFLRHQLARHLHRHPPQKIHVKSILRPTALLTPLLAFFALSLAKPFAHRYANGGELTSAALQLVLAAAIARAVLLFVKSRGVAYFIAAVIMLIAVLDVTGFMASTKIILDSVAFTFGKFRLSMLGFSQGIIILVIVFWGANTVSTALESHLQKSSRLAYNTRELIVKFFKIFVYCTAFLITMGAMGIDLTALAIFGGALGVGVGLGLQKITANFVSGITLLIEKSIKIGDLIEVNNITGWVRALNIRYALIETFDGRELLIPNEMLISMQVTNWTYTTNNARTDIDINITFDSDGKRARDIMLEIAKAHPRCLKDPEPACHLREFTDCGQHFLLTFWIPDIKEGRFGPRSDVLFSIMEKFHEAGIALVERGQVPA